MKQFLIQTAATVTGFLIAALIYDKVKADS